ncbi:MAG: CorA family divalent cation transporter [Armatimonas sp.]
MNSPANLARCEGSATSKPLHALLFDAQGNDHPVSLKEISLEQLSDEQVLWVNVDRSACTNLYELTEWLGIPAQELPTKTESTGRPRVENFGSWLKVQVQAIGSDGTIEPLSFLVGINWIVTIHDAPIEVLDNLNHQIRNDTQLGRLSGAGFLAAMLDWHLTSFFRSIERLDAEVDVLDDQAIAPDPNTPILPRLRVLRKKIAALRRLVIPHREVFSTLQRPDIASVFELTAQDPIFDTLANQMERVVDSIDNSRDLVLGSFEMYTAQMSQRTNDIMRVLTVVTVLLLPVGTLAGILGMNFQAGFFDSKTTGFIVAVGFMLCFVTIGWWLARRKGWL